MLYKEVSDYLHSLADPTLAKHHQRFFKTAEGEYGHGDIFLGIRVPVIRQAVKKYKTIPLGIVAQLLTSEYHEFRLFALLLLVNRFSKSKESQQEEIYNLYLANTKYINNWDLVDSSAHYIVGDFLQSKDKSILYDFAKSESLWERRIGMMATFYFIKKSDFNDALKISEILLHDKEDLIHKAVGWMLREIGNRDLETEETFLASRYKNMPRTMLRYAIEKFENDKHQQYLKGTI